MKLGGHNSKDIDHYWHLRTTDEVLQELNTDTGFGLSESESQRRKQKHGRNQFASGQMFPWHTVLLEKLNSFLIYILFAAAIISLIAGEYVEAVVIFVIIVMTVSLGFFQESTIIFGRVLLIYPHACGGAFAFRSGNLFDSLFRIA